VPEDPNQPYDVVSVIKKVVDDNTLFEIMPTYAPNIVCGFARMEGRTVGVGIYPVLFICIYVYFACVYINVYICP
jgi:hypothetical protein